MRRYTGVILIVLVALNLRPAVVAVGPLLRQIQSDLGMSDVAAGALTTLPVLFFGAFGLVAPLLRRNLRGEVLLVTSMGLLVVGMVLRLIPVQAALFGGALLAGIAISIGNIAVPSIIKRDHPQAITTVTAIYTVAITAGAGIASSIMVPLEHALSSDWSVPLVLLAIPAAVAGAAWLPRLRGGAAATPPPEGASPQVWRSRLAWQVTGFMGLQSMLAYITSGWLPTICQDRGLSEAAGGYVFGVSSLFQALGALLLPVVVRRLRDQRPIVVLVAVLCGIGFAGVVWTPIGAIWAWAVVLGLGQGAGFAVALSFIGLRASDAHVTAQLSGMAQGLGYVIAALGPLAIGAVHDATHGWSVPAVLMLAISAALLVPGLGAGRDRVIGDGRPRVEEPVRA